MGIRIRSPQPRDLAWLSALEQRAFTTDQMSERAFRRFLSVRTASFLVAELAGKPAGYAIVLYRARSTVARLYSIAVEPELGGRKVGQALLRAAERAAAERGATELRLEVRPDNQSAARLYSRAGYREFGRHDGYYGDGAPALRLKKALRPSR